MFSKLIFFQVIAVVAPIAFYVFTEFVERKLPERGVSGWRIFRVGGFIVLLGFWIAVYLFWIRVGAVLSFSGSVIGGIGLVTLSSLVNR